MTAAELATLALRQLGVIGANESADANDQAEALAAYERYFAELEERTLATWDYDDVPARVQHALSMFLAVRLAPLFFSEGRDANAQRAQEAMAERQLMRIIQRRHIGGATEADYY